MVQMQVLFWIPAVVGWILSSCLVSVGSFSGPLAVVNGGGPHGIGWTRERSCCCFLGGRGKLGGVGKPDEPVSSSGHEVLADLGAADCWSRGTTDVWPYGWGLLEFFRELLDYVLGRKSWARFWRKLWQLCLVQCWVLGLLLLICWMAHDRELSFSWEKLGQKGLALY